MKCIRELDQPLRVIETNGGFGVLYNRAYRQAERGVVFEVKEEKVQVLARQRPHWSVYQCRAEQALREGVGFRIQPTLIDIDPYGQCWPIVEAMFFGLVKSGHQGRLAVVVNCGLKQKLQVGGGWNVASMADAVRKYGSNNLYRNYLDVCQEEFTKKAAQAGYGLRRWMARNCGHGNNMTHYAAIIEPRGTGN